MPVANTPDTHARTPAPAELADLLHHLDSWPNVHMERWPDGVTFRVRDVVIGTLELGTRTLSVNIPADKVRVLLSGHPQLVGMKDGVTLHVVDTDSRTTAEALLRWRTNLERFSPQLLAASP
jgi:hypothetical protein